MQKPLEITSNTQDQASQTEIFETAAALAMEDATFFEQRAITKYASGGRFTAMPGVSYACSAEKHKSKFKMFS